MAIYRGAGGAGGAASNTVKTDGQAGTVNRGGGGVHGSCHVGGDAGEAHAKLRSAVGGVIPVGVRINVRAGLRFLECRRSQGGVGIIDVLHAHPAIDAQVSGEAVSGTGEEVVGTAVTRLGQVARHVQRILAGRIGHAERVTQEQFRGCLVEDAIPAGHREEVLHAVEQRRARPSKTAAAEILLIIVVGIGVAQLARPALDDVIPAILQLHVIAQVVTRGAQEGGGHLVKHTRLLRDREGIGERQGLLGGEPVLEIDTEIETMVGRVLLAILIIPHPVTAA